MITKIKLMGSFDLKFKEGLQVSFNGEINDILYKESLLYPNNTKTFQEGDLEKEKSSYIIKPKDVLFFDMDGTLIDTNFANFLSYKEAIYHVIKEDISIMQCTTTTFFNRDKLKSTFPFLNKFDYEKIIQTKEDCYKHYLYKTTLIESNVSILRKYANTNKTILVTNCRWKRALETLSYHGLIHKFTTFCCKEESEENTLNINKYQKAIYSLKMSPNDVIAFENEDKEIVNALCAKIKIVNPKILL